MKLVNPVTVPTSEAVKLVKLVKQTNLTSALTETGKPSDYIYISNSSSGNSWSTVRDGWQ